MIDDDETIGMIRYSARFDAAYICENEHETTVTLSTDAEVPPDWECASCGEIAILKNSKTSISSRRNGKSKHSTPWDKLMERRAPEELEVALNERLRKLKTGEEIRIFTI
ncbi:MAG: RNA polymerase-binding protein RbpA [Candidatus Ancillula sp.]|jgi:hypothetical protein|nr:RNA polymerase-binding protein RbpA [Candidatus Ancillula sp.]